MRLHLDRRAVLTRSLCAIAIIMLLSCAPAAVVPYPANTKPSGKLSARLEMLANSPGLHAASVEEQARTLSLPAQGAGSLMRDAQGRLLVNIRMAEFSDALVQAIRDAGATITHVSERYRTVTAFVGIADLNAIANLTTVESIQEELAPGTGGGAVNPTAP